MNCIKKFIVEPNSKVRLDEVDAGYTGGEDRNSAEADLEKYSRRLHDLQYLMYAESERSLLVILQGMDGAGKDGTINHVLTSMNPQGCRVYAFKAPSVEELSHDFLWRITQATPRKGYVSVFNRSHYEDVLVVRVHGLVPKKIWLKRYDQINSFEKHLIENGTQILKFYLHIDREEQLARFRGRLSDPQRHWKISESDFTESELWDDYEEAYEDVLSKCSTDYAPWFIIPSNHKWFRNLAISQILVETLESLDMRLPQPVVDIGAIKKKYRKMLA